MHPDSRRKLQPQDPECYHLTMSTEEHITQLTAQITALQAQLACHSWSPPPPQPSAPMKPPKVSAPSPFSGAQDDLDRFKAECSLYLSMRQSKFLDDVSGRTESWGLKLLRYLLCLQGSDTEEKESQSSVTSSPNDKQIDLALWLWQSKQG